MPSLTSVAPWQKTDLCLLPGSLSICRNSIGFPPKNREDFRFLALNTGCRRRNRPATLPRLKRGIDISRLRFVPPILLRRVEALPEGPAWCYEVKLDGYRMQALKDGSNVRPLSRNEADYTHRFPTIVDAIRRLKPGTQHLDGELVARDAAGRPSFQVLQAARQLPRGFSTKGVYKKNPKETALGIGLGDRAIQTLARERRRSRFSGVLFATLVPS
jgi:hypothetical protein